MIAKFSLGLARSIFCGSILAFATSASLAAPSGAGDPGRGSKLFLQCAACHPVTAASPHAMGPNLAGAVGAKAATKPGYVYSSALIKSGLTWNVTTLDAFLKRPMQVVPGTKMVFGGVADTKARTDLIAYLATLKKK